MRGEAKEVLSNDSTVILETIDACGVFVGFKLKDATS